MVSDNKLYPKVSLDKNSSEPLHLQLSKAVFKQIVRGRPEADVRILSERKLSEKLNLARSTVHRAYYELLQYGILEQRPNRRGLFIAKEAHIKHRQPFPNIGILIPIKFSDYISPQYPQRFKYISGIIDRATELNFSTMMLQLPDNNIDEQLFLSWEKHVFGKLSGIIHLGERGLDSDPMLEKILDDVSIPQIFISGFTSKPNICSITGDAEVGTLAAAQYLYEYGHRKVGIIALQPELNFNNALFDYEAHGRVGIILKCFEKYRIESKKEWHLFNYCSEKNLCDKLKNIFASGDTPTAFWCGNDDIANKLIEILHDMNLEVPKDISIIGYDDLVPQGAKINITSIKQPFYLMGCKAAELLVDYYNNGVSLGGRKFRLPTSLVIKNSVAAAQNNHFSLSHHTAGELIAK